MRRIIRTPSIVGFEFEDKTKQILLQTNGQYFSEHDVSNKFGGIKVIDHLLICSRNENSLAIAIQNKWTASREGLKNINYFRCGVDDLYKHIKIPIIAIYLTKSELTKNAQESLNGANTNTNINAIVYRVISGSNEQNLFNSLAELLYSHQIYFYDFEGCTIMLPLYNETVQINQNNQIIQTGQTSQAFWI